MGNTDSLPVLPGIRSYQELSPWRINQNDKTLIYVFGEAARELTSKWHTSHQLDQQQHDDKGQQKKSNMAIEVLFATDSARANAIRNPIFCDMDNKLGEIYPVTTCKATSVFNLLTLTNMKLMTSVQEYDAEFRSTAKRILKWYGVCPDNCIIDVWLHKTNQNIYDGSGTVIAKGPIPGQQTWMSTTPADDIFPNQVQFPNATSPDYPPYYRLPQTSTCNTCNMCIYDMRLQQQQLGLATTATTTITIFENTMTIQAELRTMCLTG
ncbi:hypothetical protein BDB00DRAFT_880086 [Zychaea mexicana]|uniref:uncharacterized protein n=1 Tax=Zychaea mexicana TaxID=64656 RepID=UPI0022FE7A14|nr:uncharacterized protein BDB00DRAFT_880086 [Zychaea mexicana]KAI9470467.1 hypothetical protein BDB00DRAFT_880086 [Zychaea mexicana]